MSHSKLSRRDLLILGLSLSSASMAGRALAQTGTASKHPDAGKFRTGDFLWPARQGSFFPFARTRSLGASPEELQWEAEKKRFIEEAKASGDPNQIAAAEQFQQMSFEQFRALYFEDAAAPRTRGFSPFAAAIPEVGHVAIVEIDAAGVQWVVEAMPKAPNRYESLYSRFQNGVIRTQYNDWIGKHPAEQYNVWHGRMRDLKAGQGDRIVNAAKEFLGRDYWFWSFDLSDYSGFYCSKLVWVSVWNALGITLDGDSTFPRRFWVTPKALINSALVEVLHDPQVTAQ